MLLTLQTMQGACGLDLVLHFMANTETVLERASHQGGWVVGGYVCGWVLGMWLGVWLGVWLGE